MIDTSRLGFSMIVAAFVLAHAWVVVAVICLWMDAIVEKEWGSFGFWLIVLLVLVGIVLLFWGVLV